MFLGKDLQGTSRDLHRRKRGVQVIYEMNTSNTFHHPRFHALCWSCFFQDPPFGSVGFVWMWTCQKYSKKSVSLKLEDFHWKRTDCTLWGNSNFRQETFMFWLRSPLATSWGRWLWVQYWASLQRWPWRQRWGMILAFSPCKKATALCIFTIVWELTLEVCDNSDGTTHLWPLMPLQRSRE